VPQHVVAKVGEIRWNPSVILSAAKLSTGFPRFIGLCHRGYTRRIEIAVALKRRTSFVESPQVQAVLCDDLGADIVTAESHKKGQRHDP
jgi:hypothetical protein